ncbi:P-loop containing nucleoside triphosphate hydrolase protein [Zychaea mexicana]|uniref:P-loop containing nucleoside triphosphate hydrolase protein n=1 Tax=Zychaea mexicana TaxID=64656 RepID=UPI0022FE4EC1|nr:P-loop containing nucleoside triphosphate hydrolase protein [Zychaea mexicana]KAI9493299.1 P-loop containing nucleoside triphosphate hydrolase protein [Zychaea mexicana]
MKGNAGRLSRSLEHRVSDALNSYKEQGYTDWSTSTLYEYLQKTDVSLRRQKKKQLENIIEKILPDFEASADEENEGEVSEDEDQDAGYALPIMQQTNSMNRSVTNLWNLQKNDSPASTPTQSEATTPIPPSATTTPTTEVPPITTGAATTIVTEEKKSSKKRSKAAGGGTPKRVRTETRDEPFVPSARLSDLGGIDHCVEEIMELIAMPLAHPEVYIHTGVQPPRGVLLHGPPGCGKTRLAHAIAGELGVPFLNISAPSIVSGMSGESEKKIRDVFEDAKTHAPCLLFIDEIDAITPKRETAQREMERRIVAQLLTCMDDLSWDKTNNRPVMIIGATNRPDSLDPALRRAGRFDREISMGVPDEKAREKILRVLAEKLRLEGKFDFLALARATPGYVGADLQALITQAGVIAVKRIFKHLQSITISSTVNQNNDDTNNTKPEEQQEQPQQQSEQDNAMEEGEEGEEGEQQQQQQQRSIENAMDIDATTVTEDATEDNQPIPTTTVEEFESQSALEQLRSIADFIQKHKEPLTPAQLESLAITEHDFQLALPKVQPSSKREGFATVPDVSWDDIGALQFVRDELRMAVVEPINHPEFFERVGITSPAGVLLWGPPGCGKTLLAKAVANESNTNFISVKGPELLNKYVGESERGVRQVFARARASSPCVIFFDELDALCSRRDDQQTDSSARVVNTLLTELDGVENRSQVYVIAATNRPDMIDPAMLRPGRLDKLLYVELPTPAERLDILTKLTKKTPLAEGLPLKDIADDSRCNGFSGADLAALVRESAVASLRSKFYSAGSVLNTDATADEIFVEKEHFDMAFTKVSPSVLSQDKLQYDKLRKKFG